MIKKAGDSGAPCAAIWNAIHSGDFDEMKKWDKLGEEQFREFDQALGALRNELTKETSEHQRNLLLSAGEISRPLSQTDWLSTSSEGFSIGGSGSFSLPGVSVGVGVSISHERFEKIVDEDNLTNIAWLQRGLKLSRAIARIRVPGGYGTGFLIGPGKLLTNNHVIPSEAIAASPQTFAEFNFERDFDGNVLPSRRFNIMPDGFETNQELDYSIVSVEGEPESTFGLIDLSNRALPVVDSHVPIIQHPSGGYKQVALVQNRVHNLRGNFVQYTTDTEPGSSGSCVFDSEWRPVAIHHRGGFLSSPKGGVHFINQGVLLNSIANDAREIFQLPDPLEDKIFGRLRPILTQAVSEEESLVPFVNLLVSYPKFNESLNLAILNCIGPEGVKDSASEIAPVLAAAIGVASGAGIQILSRNLETFSAAENGATVPNSLRTLVQDATSTVQNARQAYRTLLTRVDDIRDLVPLFTRRSELMEAFRPAASEILPVAAAAFLAGVTAGAAAARP